MNAIGLAFGFAFRLVLPTSWELHRTNLVAIFIPTHPHAMQHLDLGWLKTTSPSILQRENISCQRFAGTVQYLVYVSCDMI